MEETNWRYWIIPTKIGSECVFSNICSHGFSWLKSRLLVVIAINWTCIFCIQSSIYQHRCCWCCALLFNVIMLILWSYLMNFIFHNLYFEVSAFARFLRSVYLPKFHVMFVRFLFCIFSLILFLVCLYYLIIYLYSFRSEWFNGNMPNGGMWI